MSLKVFEQEDEDTWVLEGGYNLPNGQPPIRVSAFNEEDSFGIENVKVIAAVLSNIDALIFQSAELILENYSYEHFIGLGIAATLLPHDTPESVINHITLIEAYFFDFNEGGFMLSFSGSWDPEHSFDIEFKDGKAQSCSVNG